MATMLKATFVIGRKTFSNTAIKPRTEGDNRDDRYKTR